MIKALRGYVLIDPAKKAEKSTGGIILPESAQEGVFKGTVVSTGEDMVTELGKIVPSPVKVGEIVVHKKYGGEEIKDNGKEYLLVRFEDLIAVLE